MVIDRVELEESGPLRAMVRLEGMTTHREPARVILRVEACAGRSHVRVFHTIEFLHKDPRTTFLRRMGLRLPVAIDRPSASAGTQTGATVLPMGAWAGLTQDSYMHYAAWSQDESGLCVNHNEGNRSRGWLNIAGQRAGLAVMVRNMWQEAPLEMHAMRDDSGAVLTINLWPESSPLMDVRRYSNYPHLSQGETVPDRMEWVDDGYYPSDPFVGVSKTHELLLHFHDGTASDQAIDSLSADFNSPPLVYAGAKWYADTQVILPTILPGDQRYALSDGNLQTAARFILFHQKHWNWYGKWDFGDIIHMFKRGYGKIVPPARLAEVLRLDPQERKKLSLKELQCVQDYWPQHDWAFDNGRWGWGNTEGLPNLLMQVEYLRTGDRDIYFFMEAMARHERDVDMRHAGMWFGRGTRHGVQHWSCGDHEERQTIHGEFRYHHYLSGDMRSADFAKQLADEWYLKGVCAEDADHSGRLYGLLTRWEMTGDTSLARTLQNYVHSLCLPEGIATCVPVRFPEGVPEGAPTRINDGGMFFLYFGAMHALLEYYELTRDPILGDAMVKYACDARGDIVDGGWNRQWGPIMAMAFAARYADDPAPFQSALGERLRAMHRAAYQQFPEDRRRWTGPEAPVIHFPIALFWLNEQGYAMTALPHEPHVPADQLQAMRDEARYSGGTQIPVERESWQDEYDRSEFREYLTPRRPVEP